MWATSEAFDVALHSTSRRWNTKIEVIFGTDVLTSLDTIVSGYVGMDDVAVRRECHFTVVDADGVLTPVTARDMLTPKGTEVRCYRGLEVKDGITRYSKDWEWVPLGVFGIAEPEVRGHSDGTVIEVKGFDRVDTMRDRRFVFDWVIPNGAAIDQTIADIVLSRLTVPVRITQSTYPLPAVVYERLTDAWDAVREIAEAGAVQAYFDQLGTLVIAPDEPTLTGYSYTPIGNQALLMTSARKFSKDYTYSGVIVRGQHPDKTPVYTELWDLDPKSATYSDGPFGRRPFSYYSELITSQAMADAKAAQLLPTVTRIAQEITVEVTGHPGHDIGDVIELLDPRTRTSGLWQIVSATVPLRPAQGDHIRLRCKEYLP